MMAIYYKFKTLGLVKKVNLVLCCRLKTLVLVKRLNLV